MYIVYGISEDNNIIDGANWSSKRMAYQLYFEYNYFGGIAFIIDTTNPSAYAEGVEAMEKCIIEKIMHYRRSTDSENLNKTLNIAYRLRHRQVTKLNEDLKATIGRRIPMDRLVRENADNNVPKVIASYCIVNTISLNVYQLEEGADYYVLAGLNNDKPRKYKLYDSSKGSYFNFKGNRYYLNDFMRV